MSTPKPVSSTTKTTTKLTTPPPPTTPIQPETTTKDLGTHVPSCANDELLDCIGVGVYESLNYESWCNTYCGAGRPVCTPELCRCNCKKKVTCFAIGDYEDIPGLDDWCTDTCQYGCDSFSHICSCNWVSITVWLWNKMYQDEIFVVAFIHQKAVFKTFFFTSRHINPEVSYD